MSRPEHPRVAAMSSLLAEAGAAGQVLELPGSARTAAEAAGELGVPVGAIANSLLFDVDGAPLLVLTSGAHRVDVVVMDFATDTSGDPTYQEALRIVVDSGKASASLLQRRLGIGYAKAARYIDTMEEQGIVGQASGNSKPRDVLVRSLDELGGDSNDDEELG